MRNQTKNLIVLFKWNMLLKAERRKQQVLFLVEAKIFIGIKKEDSHSRDSQMSSTCESKHPNTRVCQGRWEDSMQVGKSCVLRATHRCVPEGLCSSGMPLVTCSKGGTTIAGCQWQQPCDLKKGPSTNWSDLNMSIKQGFVLANLPLVFAILQQ